MHFYKPIITFNTSPKSCLHVLTLYKPFNQIVDLLRNKTMHQNHSFSQNQVKSNHTYSWIKSSSRARFNHSNTSLEIHLLAENIVTLTKPRKPPNPDITNHIRSRKITPKIIECTFLITNKYQ